MKLREDGSEDRFVKRSGKMVHPEAMNTSEDDGGGVVGLEGKEVNRKLGLNQTPTKPSL